LHHSAGYKLILYFVTHNTSSRVGLINNYILRNRNFSSILFRYFFIDPPSYEADFVPNLIVPRGLWNVPKAVRRKRNLGFLRHFSTRHVDIDLMVKNFFCANYTITHTQARWATRLSDCIVNFGKLGEFIGKLEARYNPLTEFVFKAHCIDVGTTGIPQGGSGFILSRFACQAALKHRIRVFKDFRVWEDQAIGLYLASQGFPPIALAGHNFIGHGIRRGQLARLAMGDKMPNCSSLSAEFQRWRGKKCGRFLTPLNEVIFVHVTPYPGWRRVLNLASRVFNSPPWVLWYNGFMGIPRLCQERNETRRSLSGFWNSPRMPWKSDAWY
jgi:hypothetical protein